VKSLSERGAERHARLDVVLQLLLERVRAIPDILEVHVHGAYALGRTGPYSKLEVIMIRETDLPRWDRYAGLEIDPALIVDIDSRMLTPSELVRDGSLAAFGQSMRRVYLAPRPSE